jgi:hypothetical protein
VRDEGGEDHDDRTCQADGPGRSPREVVAAQRRQQDEQRQTDGEEAAAQEIEAVVDPALGQAQPGGHDGDRHQAHRQVDQEAPPPAQVVHEQPADDRADRAGDRVDHTLVAEPATEVAGGDDVGDGGHGHRSQPTAAEALCEPRHQELVHRLRHAAGQRPGEEDADRAQQDATAAVEVAELPVEGHRGDHRERVRRHHPGHPGEAADVVDDRRQRRGDDRAVQRAHHLAELEADEDHQGPSKPQVLHALPLRHPRERVLHGSGRPGPRVAHRPAAWVRA